GNSSSAGGATTIPLSLSPTPGGGLGDFLLRSDGLLGGSLGIGDRNGQAHGGWGDRLGDRDLRWRLILGERWRRRQLSIGDVDDAGLVGAHAEEHGGTERQKEEE